MKQQGIIETFLDENVSEEELRNRLDKERSFPQKVKERVDAYNPENPKITRTLLGVLRFQCRFVLKKHCKSDKERDVWNKIVKEIEQAHRDRKWKQ